MVTVGLEEVGLVVVVAEVVRILVVVGLAEAGLVVVVVAFVVLRGVLSPLVIVGLAEAGLEVVRSAVTVAVLADAGLVLGLTSVVLLEVPNMVSIHCCDTTPTRPTKVLNTTRVIPVPISDHLRERPHLNTSEDLSKIYIKTKG